MLVLCTRSCRDRLGKKKDDSSSKTTLIIILPSQRRVAMEVMKSLGIVTLSSVTSLHPVLSTHMRATIVQ